MGIAPSSSMARAAPGPRRPFCRRSAGSQRNNSQAVAFPLRICWPCFMLGQASSPNAWWHRSPHTILARVREVHAALQSGDVLVADRG
jgi:hypothetical protein